MIFTAALEFLLKSSRSLIAIPAFVLMLGVSLVLACLGGMAARRRWKERFGREGRKLLTLGLLLAFATSYGWVRGSTFLSDVRVLEGQPLLATGVVQTVYPQKHGSGYSVSLHLNHVQVASSLVPCDAFVIWHLARRSRPSWLESGETVQVRGVLVQEVPPVETTAFSAQNTASAGTRVGPSYELVGACVAFEPPHSSFFARIRSFIDLRISRVGAGNAGQRLLLDSLVFGNSTVDAVTKAQFLSAGLLHVLAASGANILLIDMSIEKMLFPVCRKLGVPHRFLLLFLLAIVWFFTGLCGFAVSIVRASLMTTYRYGGQWFGRAATLPNAMAFAALVLVLWEPQLVWTKSSLLSFTAVAAIAGALDGRMRMKPSARMRWWRRALSHGLGTVRMTLAVEAYLLPETVLMFGQITPFSLLSNLVVDPLLIVLLPAAAWYMALIATVGDINFLHSCTVLIGRGVFALVHLLQTWVQFASQLPDALIKVKVVPWWWAALYYVVVYSFRFLWRNPRRTQLQKFVKKLT